MARSRKPAAKVRRPTGQAEGRRLYTVEVFLLSGPITEKFVKKTPVVSRTIQMRGDQKGRVVEGTWRLTQVPMQF